MKKQRKNSGYLGDLSEQQFETLRQLKQWIKDNNLGHDNPWFDDIYLLRFCRARKFDLKKAIEMWQNFMNNRIEKNIDSLMTNFVKTDIYIKTFEYYPRGFFGVDKIGRPIYIERNGMIEVDKLLGLLPEEELWQFIYFHFEQTWKHRFLACSALYDRQIFHMFHIMDLKGFGSGSWNKKTMHLLKTCLKISLDYYPEIMGKLTIINAPFIFSGIYAIIKGWVDEKTRRKISVLGSNYMKQLLEYCNEDQIPTFLGGTNQSTFLDDSGPWQEYQVVDSQIPGEVVGIKRIDDPYSPIFTTKDMASLENPVICGLGEWGTKGAVVFNEMQLLPNKNPTRSTLIEDEEKFYDIVD